MNNNSYITSSVADISIDNGILHYIYKPNTTLTFKLAEEAISQRLALQKDKAYPIFCDVRGLVTSEKIARDLLAREGSVLVRAVGFLATDPVSQRIINYYMKSAIHGIPSQIFTYQYPALRFLETYK